MTPKDVALEVAPPLGAVRAVGALELRVLAALLAEMQHEALLPAILLAAVGTPVPLLATHVRKHSGPGWPTLTNI